MDDSTESASPAYQNINIEEALSAELKELRQRFPARFPKPIYVLAAVDDSVDSQWEHRLRQVKGNRTGERITLIPYHLENSHWIGISIKSKADGQIERAEFIDPVKQSNFAPDNLQKRFAKLYPGVILQSRNFQHGNREQSAALTVENLLKAAEEAQLTDVQCTGMAHSPDQTFDAHTSSNYLIDEERSLSTSATLQGNSSKLRDLEQISSSESERFKSQGASELSVKVRQTELEIKPYDELEKDEESKLESSEMLKKQLENGLAEHDINGKEELKQQITKKQQEIESLKNEGKKNLLRKRQESLSELEQLQLLVDKIEVIESSSANNDYEVLKKQLEDGLAEHDMSSKEELKQRIIEKKQEIQSLENERKHNLVRKRKDSLSQLEQLQLLVDKLEAIKPSQSSVENNQSEEQLNIDHPINDTLEQIEMTEIVEINMSMEEESSITEESLENMHKDFHSMPPCVERFIISLLYRISRKLVGNTIVLDHSIVVHNQIELEMMKEFECLQERSRVCRYF
jgi:hypothetical protein